MSVLGCLSGIYIHPVKSLPGILLKKAYVTPNGLAHSDNIEVVDRFKILKNKKFKLLILNQFKQFKKMDVG